MKRLVSGILGLAILGFGAVLPANAMEHSHHHTVDTKDNITILINLTKDKGQTVDMAFSFLEVSLQRGNETVIWLNSDGVKIASQGSKEAAKIKEFISKGGKVYVCPVCAKKAGVTKLVEGAEFANPDIIFTLLSKDKTRVVSW
ncbi:MAG: DsrE family protein [Hydrogenothermaceae bacterium]|nr:DsrE family protein [Hydrogenothermaceae bacterium]